MNIVDARHDVLASRACEWRIRRDCRTAHEWQASFGGGGGRCLRPVEAHPQPIEV